MLSASQTNNVSSTSVATGTALLAATTPYIPPQACPTVHDITIFRTSSSGNPSAIISLLVSNPANKNYLSCQPNGLSNVAPSLRQSFSPAVCPSGWWYFDISTTIFQSRTISTATCCKSSHLYGSHFDSAGLDAISPVCYTEYDRYRQSNVTGTLIGNYSSVQTTAFTTGIYMYPAWHISWEASDVSTLVPRPPSLTNARRIATWTGNPIPDGDYDNNGAGSRGTNARSLSASEVFQMFAIIGLPIIIAFIAGVFCCFCGYKTAKRRKARRLELASPQASRSDNQLPLELTTKPVHTS